MTQEEINCVFQMTIMIHQENWFGKNNKRRDREEVQAWVAIQLAVLGIYTRPCGSGWGVIVSKDEHEKYYKKFRRKFDKEQWNRDK